MARRPERVPGFVLFERTGQHSQMRKLVRLSAIASVSDMHDTRDKNNRSFIGTLVTTTYGENISLIGRPFDEVAAAICDEVYAYEYDDAADGTDE